MALYSSSYILIFSYPCKDWLPGHLPSFPKSWCNNPCRFRPKSYSSIYLHMLASRPHKKSEIWPPPAPTFSPFVARWPLTDVHTADTDKTLKSKCCNKTTKYECKGTIYYFFVTYFPKMSVKQSAWNLMSFQASLKLLNLRASLNLHTLHCHASLGDCCCADGKGK